MMNATEKGKPIHGHYIDEDNLSFIIPHDPTPAAISAMLIDCGNMIARLTVKVETLRQDASSLERRYKKILAKTMIDNKGKGTQVIVKAMADTDPIVEDALDTSIAASELHKLYVAKLDAIEAQFVALRKVASLTEAELKAF